MSDKPRKIFVAIPSQADAVKVRTMLAVLDAMLDALIRGWAFEVRGYAGITPISNARNFAMAEFMASDCHDLVFLDDDIVWERGAINKLLDYPVDLVCGIYPYRADQGGFPVCYLPDRPELIADPNTGLLEIQGTGAGFMRISRTCAEKMIAAYPHLEYPEKGTPTGKAHLLFQLNVVEDGILWSEDMMFCRRWRAIGGQVWLDPNLSFLHIGNKGFPGNLGLWLKARAKEGAQQADELGCTEARFTADARCLRQP